MRGSLKRAYWHVIYTVLTLGALVLAAGAPGDWNGGG